MPNPDPIPTASGGFALEPGEKLLAELRPDRARYWRDSAALAIVGAAGVAAVLWFIDPGQIAVGILGALLAIAVRGVWLQSERMQMVWRLTDRRLVLPSEGSVMLLEMETIRTLMGDIQIVTRSGDKYLLRHFADAPSVVTQISQARDRRARRKRD